MLVVGIVADGDVDQSLTFACFWRGWIIDLKLI